MPNSSGRNSGHLGQNCVTLDDHNYSPARMIFRSCVCMWMKRGASPVSLGIITALVQLAPARLFLLSAEYVRS